ncbi:MAG TPA: thiamine pyrophosphate-dependent enzyme [Gemmatimonadaceae bacterium]|jgi:thiamine pyrophosphate-dependent acetolactate synthase large subunit-like protein
MNAKEALTVVHGARGERDVVVTTMTPARDWMTLPQSPLDLVLVPSAMSHATSMGLGVALAQPDRRVIICNGDGSMLMNLGSLVSIVAANATNVVVIVFDNGTYEVTGSQPVPGGGKTDFATIARGAGFRSVFDFDALADWQRGVDDILNTEGPTFVVLHVEPVLGQPGPRSPGPAGDRARRLIDALQR